MDGNESKFVAEISVDGPLAFNTEMDDIITEEEEGGELLEDKPPVSLTLKGEEEEEIPEKLEEVEEPEKVVEEEEQSEEEDQFKDYSEAAIVSNLLKEKRPDIFEEDINKDLTWEDLIEKIDGYISGTLTSAQEYQLETMGEMRDYVEFLIQGGDPKVLEQAMDNVEFSKMNVEESSEEDLVKVVTAMYYDLGVGKEESETLVETLKLKGQLKDKAAVAVERFDKKEKDIIKYAQEQDKLAREQQLKQRQEIVSNANQIIDKGNILGLDLNEAEKKDLKEMYFKPTEIIQYQDKDGNKVTKRVTKYEVLKAEFDKSIEMQLAFGKMLLDGFEFKKVKEQGELEGNKKLLDVLESRGGRDSNQRRRGTRNAYLE